MRILSIGNFSNPSWDGSLPDEEHIAQALEELGHEVVRMQREQVGAFTDKFDFILISQWDGYPPNLITTLKTNTTGALIVYWAFDYQADGQEWHERLTNQADVYLSKRTADHKYPNWRWLSQDFAPSFLEQAPDVEKDIDVLFTGSNLPWATERNETLKAIDEHFNLVIHSVNEWPGFKDVRPPVMDDGLPELYSRAKINISIDHTIESGYWSDRNAQIMCCGGFVLFRSVPLYEMSFHRSPIYLDTFEDIGECLAKISYWLINEETRNIVASCGHQFAQTHLKVIHRAGDLIKIVEGVS